MSTVQRTLRAAKQAVRKELRAKLNNLSDEEKARQSRVITEKLFSLDVYKNCQSLSLYMSMRSEVYTDDILADVFKTKKKCFIPHYIGDDMKMVLLKDQEDYNNLPLTAWNIKQPANEEIRECAIDSGTGLDVIIVPGLGFTKEGCRLGRGKGYYDGYFRKYEAKFQKKPITIGLGYTCQILDSIPVDEFDVQLNHVLFP
ncbi:5-formyltetrahydrofolate cyclo-ligase-like [Hydractinia symbiolongicarpus]|uniref:5-formyltetrahydrofolate cyclo-ligase-like n=1 Tax=Hydractinia symbiolongicarpus TaxID=13093 RepID=UPI002550B26D|nr:5-formyltetrahydrofolate cyclo-ligase-like [Hydractinia symbiolongicarpus]